MLAPHMVSTSSTLLPIFSSTHIRHVSAEITVPDLWTWVDDPSFSLPEHLINSPVGVAWSEKHNKAIWRGSNTGGRHNSLTWMRSHRHRFVALMNSTFLEAISSGQIDWTNASLANLATLGPPHSKWMDEHLDCAFTHLRCAERGWDVGDACSYLDHHFRTAAHTSMADMATYKYLPDIDGNAYSGKFFCSRGWYSLYNISHSSFPRIAHDGLRSVEGHCFRRMAPIAACTVQTFCSL